MTGPRRQPRRVTEQGRREILGLDADALARLQLTARRAGCTIGIRGGTAELGRLIELAGLAGTVPSGSESG